MAAGLGFKDFVTGEVLTAADVDGYLMQGVWVFANAAARDAAVTSPQEGNFAYLKDTNVTTYYTGSAWANLDTTGMTNPMTTTGDTIYSSSGSTPARLGIGSTGQVLTVAGGVPTWAAAGGALTIAEITSGTMPSATQLSITGLTGDYYMLQLKNLTNGTGSTDHKIRFNSSSSAIYSRFGFYQYSNILESLGADDATGLNLTVGGSWTGGGNGFIMEIKNAKNAGFTTVTLTGYFRNGGNSATPGIVYEGYFASANAITSIQVLNDNAYTYTGGTYKLIGG